jgi:hypothetical protein
MVLNFIVKFGFDEKLDYYLPRGRNDLSVWLYRPGTRFGVPAPYSLL